MKRGTMLWDRLTQSIVEVYSINKKKNWYMLAPVWSDKRLGGYGTSTMFGRPPSYLHEFCTPIWVDFPVSQKRIKKEPLYQFHDPDAWGIEIAINQSFLHTTEYLCDN